MIYFWFHLNFIEKNTTFRFIEQKIRTTSCFNQIVYQNLGQPGQEFPLSRFGIPYVLKSQFVVD